MFKRAVQKLKKTKGESLGEVLVAVLIGAIGLTFLASMIFTSSKLIKQSSETMNAYYAAVNALESQATSSGSANFYVKTKDNKSYIELKPGMTKHYVSCKVFVNSVETGEASYTYSSYK